MATTERMLLLLQQQQQQQAMAHVPSPALAQPQAQALSLCSPVLSSPSTGFTGARASPLFSTTDQPDPLSGITINSLGSYPRPQTSVAVPHDGQAPPKQLANAMKGLDQAIRLISDVRAGADMLMEALIMVGDGARKKSGNNEALMVAAEKTKHALDDLKATGRELEAAGVLSGAQQRYDDNQPWGSQIPLVCPDGAIVSYSWKRQIAGQAAASAVDKSRLALKAFTEQKRLYFPHLEDSCLPKRSHGIDNGNANDQESAALIKVLKAIENDAPGMTVRPYSRLEWMRKITGRLSRKGESIRATKLADANEQDLDASNASTREEVGVLEILIPDILRAVVSLRPAGSVHPAHVGLFSHDEAGGHVHAWGVSSSHLFQKLSEHANNTMHLLVQRHGSSCLDLLLKWLYQYRTLFSAQCKLCGKRLLLDRATNLLLPPIVRPPHAGHIMNLESSQLEADSLVYHIGCWKGDGVQDSQDASTMQT